MESKADVLNDLSIKLYTQHPEEYPTSRWPIIAFSLTWFDRSTVQAETPPCEVELWRCIVRLMQE